MVEGRNKSLGPGSEFPLLVTGHEAELFLFMCGHNIQAVIE